MGHTKRVIPRKKNVYFINENPRIRGHKPTAPGGKSPTEKMEIFVRYACSLCIRRGNPWVHLRLGFSCQTGLGFCIC